MDRNHGALLQFFDPTPKQFSQLGHHQADMFVLTIAQPGPMMGQSKVETHLVQIRICFKE
jgi:hypothetical protein